MDQLKGVGKNKVINVYPKCVFLGKSLMVNFLSSSKKKKVHIVYTVQNLKNELFVLSLFSTTYFDQISPISGQNKSEARGLVKITYGIVASSFFKRVGNSK